MTTESLYQISLELLETSKIAESAATTFVAQYTIWEKRGKRKMSTTAESETVSIGLYHEEENLSIAVTNVLLIIDVFSAIGQP